MFALSTLSIFTVVLCFNTALLGSLGLYLSVHRDAPASRQTNSPRAHVT